MGENENIDCDNVKEFRGFPLLVIGVDGGTFDIIKPMADRGELPNFKFLMDNGSWANLESTVPPITPTAWTTFMTGLNPGKHGIFDFSRESLAFKDASDLTLVTSMDIPSPTLWELLGEQGKRVCVVNVPLTYPPVPVNGIMISGLMTPNDNVTFTYPENILREFTGELGQYRLDHSPVDTDFKSRRMQEWLRDYFEIEELRLRYTLKLFQREFWDFFIVVFGVTDRVSHLFWQFQDQSLSKKPVIPSDEFREAVSRSYKFTDRALGELIKAAHGKYTVIVLSDHGFGGVEQFFMTNRWLVDKGYMTLKKVTPFNPGSQYCIKKISKTLLEWCVKSGVGGIGGFLPQKMLEMQIPVIIPRRKQHFSVVDWQKTMAYGNGIGISVNLKGRESYGIVKPGDEFRQVLNSIKKDLLEITHPVDSSSKFADWVKPASELFSGPYADKGADIYFLLRGGLYIPNASYAFRNQFAPDPNRATHRMQGILICYGRGFKSMTSMDQENCRILDIAPTLCYLSGIPVSDHFDGHVLVNFIESNILKKFPPVYKTYSLEKKPETYGKETVLSQKDHDELIHKLKGFGYLGG